MIYKFRLYIFIIPILLQLSCDQQNANNNLAHRVSRFDFYEDIIVDGTVEAVNSRTVICPRVWDVTLAYIVEDGSLVKEGDTVVILENSQLVDRYEQVKQNLEQNQAEYHKNLANLELSYALLEAQVKNNEAETAITSLNSMQLQYVSDVQRRITEKELKIAQIQKDKYQKKLKALKRINDAELRRLDIQIRQSKNQIKNMEDMLNLLILTAPQDGMALRSGSPMGNGKFKEGDMAYPGMPIVEIPDLSLMRVKIQAHETAYKRIEIGQRVEYTFDALPGNFAYGTITLKTPVGNPIARNSKVRIFDVLASVDSSNVLPGAGLSANCRVIINHIPDTLVVPNVIVFDEDTLKVVYVKEKNGFERREVITGKQSSKNSVIIAGLMEGEELSMIKPKENQIKRETFLSMELKERFKPINGNKADSINLQTINGDQE